MTDPSLFSVAIRRKLILEIAGTAGPPILPAQFEERAPRVDCLIGEKLWRDRGRYWR